jgi:hypothetical protein
MNNKSNLLNQFSLKLNLQFQLLPPTAKPEKLTKLEQCRQNRLEYRVNKAARKAKLINGSCGSQTKFKI